jgi:hypothetical protein
MSDVYYVYGLKHNLMCHGTTITERIQNLHGR